MNHFAKMNSLNISVKNRLAANYSEAVNNEFWIQYSKHRSSTPETTFENICRSMLKAAELSGVPEDFIQLAIDDVSRMVDEQEAQQQAEIIFNAQEKSYLYQLDKYMDNIEKFHIIKPFFYDKNGLFWFWEQSESRYKIVDEIDVMNAIDRTLGLQGQTVSNKHKGPYLEAFKRVGRNKMPLPAPSRWIQFKNKAYSLRSGNTYEVQSNYFFTNPIPHEIGKSSETKIFDKLFSEWVGEDNVKVLYEIIAYCCYQEYVIQSLFSLYGGGRNGKSSFFKIVQKFLGMDNICSTELDLITGNNSSRFETAKMYKKLACFMGETNFSMIQKSSMLKKLTGGDMMGYEMKNKSPFDDYNYAKILIASNTLPTSDDTSDGFYRRWIIIDFPNQFQEGKDILKDIPESEYENLAKKVTEIIPGLIERGHFSGHKDPSTRKQKYIMASNPLPAFIKERTEEDVNGVIRYGEFYNEYVKYLTHHKRRIVMKGEFSKLMTLESLEIRRTTINSISQNSDVYIFGLKWKKDNNVSNVRNVRLSNSFSHTSYRLENDELRTLRTLPLSFSGFIERFPAGKLEFQTLKDCFPELSAESFAEMLLEGKRRGDLMENPSGYYQKII